MVHIKKKNLQSDWPTAFQKHCLKRDTHCKAHPLTARIFIETTYSGSTGGREVPKTGTVPPFKIELQNTWVQGILITVVILW